MRKATEAIEQTTKKLKALPNVPIEKISQIERELEPIENASALTEEKLSQDINKLIDE